MAVILRPKATWQRLGVGRSNFYQNYVRHEGGDAFITGTEIPRLRPVPISERVQGFFDDEVDAVIEAKRNARDAGAIHVTKRRNATGRFARAADKLEEVGI